MMLTPKTVNPMCLAAITSVTVDMPTASAPIILKYLYSAGVSNVGPVVPRYTPFLTVMLFLEAIFSAFSMRFRS